MADQPNGRFGSARFATAKEIRRAGLLGGSGTYHGICPYSGKPIRVDGDASIVTTAGAGTGKDRDIVIPHLLTSTDQTVVDDPKGVLAAVTIHRQAALGKAAYCINPAGKHQSAPWFLPNHHVNPLDILAPDSQTLIADADVVMSMLIVPSGESRSEFFEQRACDWMAALAVWLIRTRDRVITLPELYQILVLVEANPRQWDRLVTECLSTSPIQQVRRTAREMQYRRARASGEFSAVMATIYKNLVWLDDPRVAASMSGSDFSLADMAEEGLIESDKILYLVVPAEYAEAWRSYRRLIIGVTMLYKMRAPAAKQIVFFISEAAQLGHFDLLLKAYEIGREFGIRIWCVFQDTGQIDRHYGDSGKQTILGSSQVRQFFGIRDYESARLFSNMLGTQTVRYRDARTEQQASHDKAQLIQQLLSGEDFSEVALRLQYQKHAGEECARPLRTPDELMNLHGRLQILFISDVNCHPIEAIRHPYYESPHLGGLYLPNPSYPPGNRVRVRAWHGRSISLPIRLRRVPDELSDLPQYQLGVQPVVGEASNELSHVARIRRLLPTMRR